jgi:hypothetical protein
VVGFQRLDIEHGSDAILASNEVAGGNEAIETAL